jgi:hypothetical protein
MITVGKPATCFLLLLSEKRLDASKKQEAADPERLVPGALLKPVARYFGTMARLFEPDKCFGIMVNDSFSACGANEP